MIVWKKRHTGQWVVPMSCPLFTTMIVDTIECTFRCLNTYRGILAVILSRTEDGRLIETPPFFESRSLVSSSDDARSGMVIVEHSNVRIRTKLMGANGSDRAPRINHIAMDIVRSRPTSRAGRTTLARARSVGNERRFPTNERFQRTTVFRSCSFLHDALSRDVFPFPRERHRGTRSIVVATVSTTRRRRRRERRFVE